MTRAQRIRCLEHVARMKAGIPRKNIGKKEDDRELNDCRPWRGN